MLNIGGLNQGIVIDHIQAGGAMKIYEYLNLEKLDCSVAIIKNAKSNKMGKKDIIKIEGDLDIDLNVLGVLDHSITSILLRTQRSWRSISFLCRKRLRILSSARIHAALLPLNRSFHTSLSSRTGRTGSTVAFIVSLSLREIKENISYITKYNPWEILSIPRVIFFL